MKSALKGSSRSYIDIHITHINESCRKLNESRRMYEWVMSQIWKSHVTLMCSRSSASCRKYKWVMSPWMRHVEHVNESCHLDVLKKLLLCPLFFLCLQLCYFFSLTLALARLPCRLSTLNYQPLPSLWIFSYSWCCCSFFSSTTASITNNTTNGSSSRVTWYKYVLVHMIAYMWIYVCTYRDKCTYICPCICVYMCDMDVCIHIYVWVRIYRYICTHWRITVYLYTCKYMYRYTYI